ncbi:hypothetical protein INS49_012759 [Diaporthe citri]|uniref:uncharacterized protein n=1 Tax=Diaporthe citri TaxID=83186 RepID=UPI001C81992E|nr:uncharacterized protein INS49_012759 [Diaporthe citri]KAG6359238.1 hypothetical protein INS49_012759 [Diaporthe citri]
MVHADASTFAKGVSKEEALQQVLDQAAALFEGQRNWEPGKHRIVTVARLQEPPFPEQGRELGGSLTISSTPIGFYVLDPTSHGKSLILGPFMGQVACQTIDFGRGVCGTAAAAKQTQLVPDVDAFPGHIACDGASRSEIVVPVTVEVVSPEEGGHVEKKVVGIIDIDCAEKNGFDETDKKYLEELAALLGRACDWLDSRLSTNGLLRGAQ